MDLKNLTAKEAELIIAALHAISPSGGGSTTYHLARNLEQQTGIIPDDKLVCSLQLTAYDEIRESCSADDIAAIRNDENGI
jgi:hypothetical protein